MGTVIRKAIQAANKKDTKGVFKDVSTDFRGPGCPDERECRRILLGYFFRKSWVEVSEKSLEVAIEGDSAKANLDVALSGGDVATAAPSGSSVLTLELRLVKLDGEWKIKSIVVRAPETSDSFQTEAGSRNPVSSRTP